MRSGELDELRDRSNWYQMRSLSPFIIELDSTLPGMLGFLRPRGDRTHSS
ncbi:hypothetical protein [Allocoleopsis sp.]